MRLSYGTLDIPQQLRIKEPPMPCTTILDISQQEQAQMLAALRRARYGYLLALHVFSY